MTALARIIADMIAEGGPITVERYMALALGHPRHGYYMTRDPLGVDGDFTTAPEISQMFGELIGLWAAAVWDAMGRPRPIALIELGPGRGTLMADALRALRAAPAMREALTVHLVETSPILAEAQRRTLAGETVPVTHHRELAEAPSGPAILIGNEFLDALPIRQFVRAADGWRERLVGLGRTGELAYGLAPEPDRRIAGRRPSGRCAGDRGGSGRLRLGCRRARRGEGGAALLLDYGHVGQGLGDTLQAVQRHAYADPLADPGEADLTAHVDFAALGRAAGPSGAAMHGPVTQGDFLRALGIRERAAALSHANPAKASSISDALERLTGSSEGRMGSLFKAFGLSHPGLGALPGLQPVFEERRIAC